MIKSLQNILPQDMEPFLDNKTAIIDLRREDEWQYTGLIKGAHKLTFFDGFGNYDIDSWLKEFEKIVKSKKEKVILVCAHANRTRTIGNFLINKLAYEDVCHLEGGMALWCEQGKEVVKP